MVITDRIVEKNTDQTVICPPIKVPKNSTVITTGFPQPPKISQQPLGRENTDSSSSFYMKPSDFAKLEWTNPITTEEEKTCSSSVRYDFEGKIVCNDSTENEYKSELYHHGSDPGRPGYTLEELFHLSQSGFASQKTIAIRSIGNIARNESVNGRRREIHRILIGEWKAHIRFSVACSDTSTNVRTAAWESLLALIESLDIDCGCIVEDLSTVYEFFRSMDPENLQSVKVMAYIANQLKVSSEDEFLESFCTMVEEACESHGLDLAAFQIGVTDLKQRLADDTLSSPAEIFAAICDRIGCSVTDPLSDEDVGYFEECLGKLRPSIPFYQKGEIDEFSWSSRATLVLQALMEGGCHQGFIAKVAWQFTSSLFPLQCRASVWCDRDVLEAIERSSLDDLGVFGNHHLVDFGCRDLLDNIDRESATVLRAIYQGCSKFLDNTNTDSAIVHYPTKIVYVLASV